MFNNKWNENHLENWRPELQLDNDGFSGFQCQLVKKVENLLESNSVKYIEQISEHSDLIDRNKTVKLVTITLTDFPESSLWIYHDMAEYDLNKIHHIYEEWGYLSPLELQNKYIENIRDIMKIK